MPGTLRDLGERMTAIPGSRRRAPALAFAAQALAGSMRYGSTLRERYLNLLAAAMDSDTAARVHPAFLEVLRQLTPDEVRIISTVPARRPLPAADRRRALPASASGCRPSSALQPARHRRRAASSPSGSPLYIDNLCRLGLAELRPVRIADDTRSFRALEAHPEVQAAIARIEARIPELESAHPQTTTATASSPTSSARRCT